MPSLSLWNSKLLSTSQKSVIAHLADVPMETVHQTADLPVDAHRVAGHLADVPQATGPLQDDQRAKVDVNVVAASSALGVAHPARAHHVPGAHRALEVVNRDVRGRLVPEGKPRTSAVES